MKVSCARGIGKCLAVELELLAMARGRCSCVSVEMGRRGANESGLGYRELKGATRALMLCGAWPGLGRRGGEVTARWHGDVQSAGTMAMAHSIALRRSKWRATTGRRQALSSQAKRREDSSCRRRALTGWSSPVVEVHLAKKNCRTENPLKC